MDSGKFEPHVIRGHPGTVKIVSFNACKNITLDLNSL